MNEGEGKRIVATLLNRVGSWADVRDSARNTVNKSPLGDGPVSQSFKRKILMAEHSPIRCLQFRIRLVIPSWVSVHLVRHKIGVDPFVTTQRDDRTDKLVSREEMPQGTPVTHDMLINAQALINISRKRLCYLASPKTTQAWLAVKRLLQEVGETEVADLMVPECVYRGFCPEMSRCKSNYVCTPKFNRDLEKYRSTIQTLK